MRRTKIANVTDERGRREYNVKLENKRSEQENMKGKKREEEKTAKEKQF